MQCRSRGGPVGHRSLTRERVVFRSARVEDDPAASGTGRIEANRPSQVAVFHHPERAVLAPSRIPTRILSWPSCGASGLWLVTQPHERAQRPESLSEPGVAT